MLDTGVGREQFHLEVRVMEGSAFDYCRPPCVLARSQAPQFAGNLSQPVGSMAENKPAQPGEDSSRGEYWEEVPRLLCHGRLLAVLLPVAAVKSSGAFRPPIGRSFAEAASASSELLFPNLQTQLAHIAAAWTSQPGYVAPPRT